MPSGTMVHIGVYNLSDRDHVEIQNRRNNFVSLLMYLTEQKLFFSVNHMFSGLTGKRDVEDFHWFASYAPAFEVRNGQMWAPANRQAQRLAKRLRKVGIAATHSHTISRLPLTYPEVKGAGHVDAFFAGLRAQRGHVKGLQGTYSKLTADIYRIGAAMFQEKPATLAMLPLSVLVPAFTAAHWLKEVWFCRKWQKHFENAEAPRMLWDLSAERV